MHRKRYWVRAHLLELVGEGGRQHVGEQLEGDREQKFHERDEDEDGERDQTEEVGSGTLELWQVSKDGKQWLP